MVGANEASVRTSYKNIESMGFLLTPLSLRFVDRRPSPRRRGQSSFQRSKGQSASQTNVLSVPLQRRDDPCELKRQEEKRLRKSSGPAL